MEHFLTVFTTVYNIAEYLPRYFACMSSQSFSDYELLLIDDGSTDNSLDVCKSYAKKDGRIQIIESEHIGISAARNLVISAINTPFMASADGDDVYEKDYLRHLVEAQKKYNADLVISRVCYRDEAYEKTGEFVSRGEKVIDRGQFRFELPMLIDDKRLNYLYGKLYRTEYFKGLRVDDDVKQGSDTMFNCQYVKKIQRIVLIDDLDTNYIKYTSRSVTSYKGGDAFERLCRINQYIIDSFTNTEYMTDELEKVIDGRILLSAVWVLNQIAAIGIKKNEKYSQANSIINHRLYMQAIERRKERNDLNSYSFDVVLPGEECKYIDGIIKSIKNEKMISILHKYVPEFVFSVYHKIRR